MDTNLYLGIELGSTRIKSVLIDDGFEPVAVGNSNWENRFEGGVWTYTLDDIWQGLQKSYKAMAQDYEARHGTALKTVTSMGISGMMHGYLPLDSGGKLLTQFRTWRNTSTKEASDILTPLFGVNIPLRWSIAHLYQAILNNESHVENIATITTLAGYIHLKLTGENVMGVGEASGMFPIAECDYHKGNMEQFDQLVKQSPQPIGWKIADIMPKVLPAGEKAGVLTKEGAALLDPSGNLQPGVPFCPPEGDAGTGMAATNSVAANTGNVSAGTSIFAMLVLEKNPSRMYPEIDIVTTPDGKPVAMVHCNNGTSDLDAWVRLFHEAHNVVSGEDVPISDVYQKLYQSALQGNPDCGGLMAISYLSGEHNTGFEEGRPLFMRMPDSSFNVPNFIRTLLLTSMATLRLGIDILANNEALSINTLMGHGGLFTTKGVAQQLMAGALSIPVSVMETANEGGAWGIALLAAYAAHVNALAMLGTSLCLDTFLSKHVFANRKGSTLQPNPADIQGFNTFIEQFKAALKVERAAVDNFVRLS